MSFGESVFLAGFIQKTSKEDLFVKANHVYPLRNRPGKNPEGKPPKRRASGYHVGLAGPTSRPPGPLGQLVSPSFECQFSTAS